MNQSHQKYIMNWIRWAERTASVAGVCSVRQSTITDFKCIILHPIDKSAFKYQSAIQVCKCTNSVWKALHIIKWIKVSLNLEQYVVRRYVMMKWDYTVHYFIQERLWQKMLSLQI